MKCGGRFGLTQSWRKIRCFRENIYRWCTNKTFGDRFFWIIIEFWLIQVGSLLLFGCIQFGRWTKTNLINTTKIIKIIHFLHSCFVHLMNLRIAQTRTVFNSQHRKTKLPMAIKFKLMFCVKSQRTCTFCTWLWHFVCSIECAIHSPSAINLPLAFKHFFLKWRNFVISVNECVNTRINS